MMPALRMPLWMRTGRLRRVQRVSQWQWRRSLTSPKALQARHSVCDQIQSVAVPSILTRWFRVVIRCWFLGQNLALTTRLVGPRSHQERRFLAKAQYWQSSDNSLRCPILRQQVRPHPLLLPRNRGCLGGVFRLDGQLRFPANIALQLHLAKSGK